jgi:hypothetical protein
VVVGKIHKAAVERCALRNYVRRPAPNLLHTKNAKSVLDVSRHDSAMYFTKDNITKLGSVEQRWLIDYKTVLVHIQSNNSFQLS